MPTLTKLAEWALQEIRKGKGELHVAHPVIVEEAAEQRKKNPADAAGKQKTKVCWDAHDPIAYSEFHEARELWMQSAGNNPRIATLAITQVLRLFTPEGRKAVIDNIGSTSAAASGVEPAELPPATWLASQVGVSGGGRE